MNQHFLNRTLRRLSDGIVCCQQQRHLISTLTLTYSAIDTTGWLACDDAYTTRTTFKNWVNRYLLPARPFDCTADDLYGARCGVLHTSTPVSESSDKGKVRQIFYSFGIGAVEDLKRWIDREGATDKCVAVNLDDLIAAWQAGTQNFLHELESDPQRRQTAFDKIAKSFGNVDVEPLQQYLNSPA